MPHKDPGTAGQGARRPPAVILLILRGIAQGVPSAELARELGASRRHLLALRLRAQARAAVASGRTRLPVAAVEGIAGISFARGRNPVTRLAGIGVESGAE